MTEVSTSVTGGPQDTHLAGRVLVHGFGTAVVMWCAAFIAHLPWLDWPGSVAGPIVIGGWLAGAALWGRITAGPRPVVVGVLGGLVTAALSLLILGALLVEQPTGGAGPSAGASGLRPSSLVYVPAFLALGCVIGGVGCWAWRVSPRGRDWLAWFALVTVISIAPLLLTGGAVTSTDSGMAIRGWPGSDAANMFLYPVSLMADPQRFLEHTHRLFGSLVGLTCITLFVYTLVAGRGRGVKVAAGVLLATVIVQGVLGGLRVIENERTLALVHGVSAQLVLGLGVGLAVALGPGFRGHAGPPLVSRRAAMTAAWLVGLMLIQLALGATYRHLRQPHAVYTHAAFAIVVVGLAQVVGARAIGSSTRQDTGNKRTLRRCGKALRHTVLVQFVLGAVTLGVILMSGDVRAPEALAGGGPIRVPAAQAAISTAHQAVGALLLALAVATATWMRRLSRTAAA